MTALEDARTNLPEAAVVSREMLDFLISRAGGTETVTVQTPLLAQQIAHAVCALEARIIALEERAG